MRNYRREAIRAEVRQEIRQQARPDGAGPVPAAPGGGGQVSGGQGGDEEVEAHFRVVLRPIASSLPLGFFAFTVGTVLLFAIELTWTP
jgi:hypothetical protein